MNTIKNRWVKNIKVQKKVNNQLTFLYKNDKNNKKVYNEVEVIV